MLFRKYTHLFREILNTQITSIKTTKSLNNYCSKTNEDLRVQLKSLERMNLPL